MKATKIILNCVLLVAACVLAYYCVESVVTPIKFDATRAEREVAVVKNLVNIRTAQAEFNHVNGRYTANLDSLVLFLQNTPKKEVKKEGSLTDKQLEAGLTEQKAVKIMDAAKLKARKAHPEFTDEEIYTFVWENDKEVITNGLQGFRRDTILDNMIQVLFKGEYTAENIAEITYIPYSNGLRFECEVNDDYKTSQGIPVPLFEARAPFETYLGDQDEQELVNLQDKETKLDHYAGLKVGSIDAPNNNAGNWE